VKKAELKAGVAYYVTSRNNWATTYTDAAFRIHQQHKSNRFYIIEGADGQPMSYYRNASQIYMTNCPTYGADCPTHRPKEGYSGIACYKTDFRLMDVRDEYWAVIKRLYQRRKDMPKRDIRAERLARIAKRQKQDQEAPIKDEFYSVLKQVANKSWISSSTTLGGFTIDEMKAITNALKAGLAVEIKVAS
jgi:hypothetical protein